MSATSLRVVTVDFPNPEWVLGSNDQFHQVNTSISYWALGSHTPVTLSSHNAQPGNDITGLLYVPDLPSDDACSDAASPYVPNNVTRRSDLPDAGYDLIAIAPWLSPDCVQEYLRSARRDSARALISFLPNNSTAAPPNADDPSWALGDGEGWKNQNQYPVYAISGAEGNELMRWSAQYSGNVTDAPWGHDLTESGIDSRDYVRLFADISTGGGTALPSLWVFLLVVLGILLGIVGCTSFSMHILQRRRRVALRRRIASGEVDLEALGIKRLTVPQEVLDRMPLYTYGTGAPVPQPSTAREASNPDNPTTSTDPLPSVAEDKLSTSTASRPSSPDPNIRPTPALIRNHSYRPTPLQQPTCAICLDDFVPASEETPTGTIVRELPCHHIFHPECVDAFLRDSSSLCPMCKKSALPKGYCPRVVTNAMVRRERMMQGLRPEAGDEEDGNAESPWRRSRVRSWAVRRDGAGDGRRGVGRFFSAPVSGTSTTTADAERRGTAADGGQEMHQLPPPTARTRLGTSLARERRSVTQPARTPSHSNSQGQSRDPPIQPPATASRREWARERAVAMLGRERAPLDPDADEAERTSGWRKVVRGVFPGFGRR
ncbi:uncharacterized protein LTR77_004108 [Saxophila tyrrhenica]|uniref:RING-type domain-containing protein n=1 Tax=Saxophila tyrrhenica TaxID=1690608 RepID=A0AAV9PEC7_9PEZI|nr:hypothetical protein LTR77_004108 [Saxophila tyrrhenica]